ncbi:MAG TPA: response regulator transcription factor [Humisphaera sp.]
MRLLIAEDDPSLARSLADGFREEGYAVDMTFDGREAAHLVTSNPYDAAVLDVMLPNVDGLEIVSLVRRKDIPLPVLFLTARDGIHDRVRGLDLGADDYLVKPFSWTELLARVRAIIRRGHGKTSPVIRVGDLEVDVAAKAVRRAGRSIALSAREFGLLEYLAHRAGQVVTRTDIWEHLYDQHDQTMSNVVDVYIGYLRNKIDKGFGTRLIHTRRGQGYLLATAEEAEPGAGHPESEGQPTPAPN